MIEKMYKEISDDAEDIRLIDGNALLKNIPPEEITSRMAVAYSPTIVPTRRTAKWLPVAPSTYACSDCGNIRNRMAKFCESCGARMMEDEDE